MKLLRLGRTSFRAVKTKRDYLKHRSSYNWLYLSRLAALKEFAFMKALEEHGFPMPNAVDCNRHYVVMSLVQGYPLVQVKQLQNPEIVFEMIIGLIVHLAEHGLIHYDFNEFNVMIDDDERVTTIDFPQMVSVSHHNAQMYFDRDVECVYKFFNKRFNMSVLEDMDDSDGSNADMNATGRPNFSSISKVAGFLDKELAASGFTSKDQDDIEKFIEGDLENDVDADDEGIFVEGHKCNTTEEETINNFDSLCLLEQERMTSCSNSSTVEEDEGVAEIKLDEQESTEASDKEDVEQVENEDNLELTKCLSKQRRQAIAAAHRGRRTASRNAYRDKGRKSSQNSKIQKQLKSW